LDRKNYGSIAHVLPVMIFACLIGASTATYAQDGTKPVTEKWRPKDGPYIIAGTDFTRPCEESAQYLFELGKKSVIGQEAFKCQITKITDTTPVTLRLDLTCEDDERGKFKEIITLRKINAKSLFMRMTRNGKFGGPEWQIDYCPKDAAKEANDRAEAEKKAAEERSGVRGWRPRDGVYASPAADFEDRCLKSGDAIIRLAQNSVSSGAASCYVSKVADAPPYGTKLAVICNQSGTQGLVMRTVNGETTFEPAGAETMILKKIDEQTVSLQKSLNGQFSEPAQQLSYCPEAAQRLR
jgi:hypothetical protein